jgi:hypothetical protein
MDGSEDLLREIARIEDDIAELEEYRSSALEARERALGWARFKSILHLLFFRRQMETNLRYLKLRLEAAQVELEREAAGSRAQSSEGSSSR